MLVLAEGSLKAFIELWYIVGTQVFIHACITIKEYPIKSALASRSDMGQPFWAGWSGLLERGVRVTPESFIALHTLPQKCLQAPLAETGSQTLSGA